MNVEPSKASGQNKTPHRNYARTFVSNVFFGLLAQAVRLLVSMFLLGYLVRRLGEEQWGLVVLATSVVAMLSLIQLGASAGIGKKLNMFLARGESEAFQQYFTAGLVLCSVMAVFMLLGIVILLTVAWPALKVEADLAIEGKLVIGAVGISAILNSFMLPLTACMQASHRVDVFAKLNTVSLLLRTGSSVLFFEIIAPKASIYAFILAASVALVFLGSVLWVRRNVPEARVHLSSLNKTTLRDLAGFNLLTLFNSLNYVLFLQSPAIILQRSVGLAMAGLYGIALQLNTFIRAFLLAGLNAISPVAISLVSTGDVRKFKTLYRISTKTYSCVAMFMWLGFAFLGEPLLRFWLDRDVSELLRALPWLIGASSIGVAAMPSAVFTIALERLRIPGLGGLALAGGMIAAMFWVIGWSQTDLLVRCGITLFVFFGAYQILRVFVVSRAIRLRPVEVLMDMVVRPAIPAVAVLLTLWVATRFIGVLTILHLIGMAAVSLVIFVVFSFAFLYSRQERLTIKNVISSIRPGNK